MNIEVKVSPNSSSLAYYKIQWRKKKLFSSWKTLVKVWDGAFLNYDQPVLFSDFEEAVRFAKGLKNNPELIKQHYDKQDKIYQEAKKRRKQIFNARNKTEII